MEKNIEERARKYATKLVGGEYVGGFKGEVWLDLYHKYIEIATEQRKIDTEKSCEAVWDVVSPYVNTADDCEAIQNSLRKALEDK